MQMRQNSIHGICRGGYNQVLKVTPKILFTNLEPWEEEKRRKSAHEIEINLKTSLEYLAFFYGFLRQKIKDFYVIFRHLFIEMNNSFSKFGKKNY